MSGVQDSRNPSDCSVLSHSDNRRICGFAIAHQNLLAQTSHIPRTMNRNDASFPSFVGTFRFIGEADVRCFSLRTRGKKFSKVMG